MRRVHPREPRRLGATRWVAAALAAILSTSCISSWSEFPRPSESAEAAAVSSDTLYYEIVHVSGLFGGGEALRDAFREHAPFERVEPLSQPPKRGLFCRVESERHSPNVASGIAAYVSYVFLFAIPFWSTEGYAIRYHVYLDGEERKIFEYDITRKSFFWILALPFSWASLLTPSERDAFEGTVHQFFADLRPYVRGHLARAR